MKNNYCLNYDDNAIIKIELLNKNKVFDSFSKPIDLILNKTLKDISISFLKEFNPSTIYTHNNKIFILFKSNYKEIKTKIIDYKEITNDVLNDKEIYFSNLDIEYKLIDKNDELTRFYDSNDNKIKTIENQKLNDITYEKLIINNFIYKSNVEKIISNFSSFLNNSFNKELIKNINTFKEENDKTYKSKKISDYLLNLEQNVLFNNYFNFEIFSYKNDKLFVNRMIQFQTEEIKEFRTGFVNYYKNENFNDNDISELYDNLDNDIKIGTYLKLKDDNNIKNIVEEIKNTSKNINFFKKLKLKSERI